MNGNGELAETENVSFYVSYGIYGILTDERNSYVLATETATATERWKSA